MQTPGLPASQPTSANRSATNSVFEKHSRAGEHFGDVMHRALTSRDFDEHSNQHTTARPQHHSHSAENHTAKSKNTPDKPDEATNNGNKKYAAGHKSENSELIAPLTEITTPPSPVTVPSPTANQSRFFPDESRKDTSIHGTPTPVKQTHFARASITPAPVAPASITLASNTSAPTVSAHITSARNISIPITPVAPGLTTPAPTVPAPITPVRITPTPATPAPVSRAHHTPVSIAPTSITSTPTTPGPVTPIPISVDATNTKVSDTEPTETEPTNNSAPEAAATPQDSKMSETADSADTAQKTPAATTTEELAAAVEAINSQSGEAKTVTQGDSAPQPVQIAPAKTGHERIVAPPADPHGTSAAKQDMTMKKAEKTQKVAGPAEQDLPGNAATGSEELPQGQKLSAKAAVHGEKPESTAIELPTRISTSVESPAPTVTAVAPAPAPSIDSRVLERTHDIVALHAMRLTDTGADSLRVVVKPGGGVQLSLELRQSARGIEVSAELHKGDYQHLNQHWSDLQQRLEARGVRVSSLTTAENYTGGQHFNQSKQQSSNQDPLYAGAFAEFALAGSMTEAPDARAARATAYRGWETWA